MSTINKKPYIKSALSSLTKDQLKNLAKLVDGEEVPISYEEWVEKKYGNPNKKQVQYNDEDYEITLEGEELQYCYPNLNNAFENSIIGYDELNIRYNGNVYYYNDDVDGAYVYTYQSYKIAFIFDEIEYNSASGTNFLNNVYINPINDEYLSNNLTLIDSGHSGNLKPYIQYDIEYQNHVINLSPNQLNNYTYPNLVNYVNTLTNYEVIPNCMYSEYKLETNPYDSEEGYVSWAYDGGALTYDLNLNNNNDNKFNFLESGETFTQTHNVVYDCRLRAYQGFFEALTKDLYAQENPVIPELSRTIGFNSDKQKISEDDKGVHKCLLETPNKVYTGYLLYNHDNYCTFISINDNQALSMIKINVAEQTFELIKEYLDINELRSELDDRTEEVDTDIEVNPSDLSADAESLTGLRAGGKDYKVPELDSDVTVEISTDGGSTYANSITLQEFIDNCEAGNVYTTVGTIARVSNCINGSAFRFILIGTNHDVLANTDAGELEPNGTKAKTTWQFYDMPVQKVNLGLPYEEEKTGNIRYDQTGEIEDCPEVTIDTMYPSNMHGYTSAVGLLDALQSIFNSLPATLQNAMKLVRKDCFISEIDDGDNYEMFDSTASMIFHEQDRYGSAVAQKLFCLSAFEMGYTKGSNENPNFPTTIEVEIDDEQTDIKLEGSKYAYFEEGDGSTAIAKRIRYFNGNAWYYWLRSPYVRRSYFWGFVIFSGSVSYGDTYCDRGVAPAFCI